MIRPANTFIGHIYTKGSVIYRASDSHSVFSRMHLMLCATLLILLLRLVSAAQDTDLIGQGDLFQKHLSRTESHSYKIALKSSQYLCLALEVFNSDVEISIYGPNLTLVKKITCWQNGPIPVSIVAKEEGLYRIELRSVGSSEAAAVYDLSVREIRATEARDQNLLDAEIAFAEAELLRSELSDQSLRKAIDRYAQAARLWRTAGDRGRQAVVGKITGEIYSSLGQPDKALDSYRDALTLSQQAADKRIESEILSGLTDTYLHLGRNQEAKEYALRAIVVSQEAKNLRAEAQAFSKMGDACSDLEESNDAVSHYEKSLSLWSKAGDLRGQAQALLNLGFLNSDSSNSEKAIDYFDQAMKLWKEVGDLRGQAFTLTARGYVYSRVGKKQEALDLFTQAKPLFEQTNEKVGEASRLNGMGHVYESLGDVQKSLGHYQEALRLFRSTQYLTGISTSTWSIGGIYYLMGDYQKALSHLQESLQIMRALGNRIWEAYVLRSIGKVYTSQGEYKDALLYLNQSLSLFQSDEDSRGEAHTVSCIGEVYLRKGDRQKALEYKKRSLKLNQKAGDFFGETATLSSIARIERDEWQIDSALANVKAAIQNIERSRSDIDSLELRASYLAAVRQSYELYIDLLMVPDQKRQGSSLAIEALDVSEQARARVLLDMLTEARADLYKGVDMALVERERALQKQIYEKINNLLKARAGSNKEEEESAEKELDDALDEHQKAQAQIRLASPRYSALTQPQTLTAREIQEQLLDADTLLLEYALGDDRSYLWAVTRDSITTSALPARAEVEEAARKVYELLTEPNREVKGESYIKRLERINRKEAEYWNAAARLSQMILAPVAGVLGKKRLLIVADGALQYIPFAALPDPRSRESRVRNQESEIKSQESRVGSRESRVERQDSRLQTPDSRLPARLPHPLIVEHEIVHLPSASILSVLRRESEGRPQPSKAVAVFADPVFSRDDPKVKMSEPVKPSVGATQREERISSLPFSRKEAIAILEAVKGREAMTALGFDANRERVLSEDLSQYRIVHFATHGFIDSERPELSEILLSLVDEKGQEREGSLRLYEIYGLRLAADLVVLSACQTALGKDVRGEGLVGLVRGFMYAGASRVVASLWSVNDAATAELMNRFYKKMMAEGLRPAEALRAVQIEMFKQNRWHNPYYWAAFSLQGDWK